MIWKFGSRAFRVFSLDLHASSCCLTCLTLTYVCALFIHDLFLLCCCWFLLAWSRAFGIKWFFKVDLLTLFCRYINIILNDLVFLWYRFHHWGFKLINLFKWCGSWEWSIKKNDRNLFRLCWMTYHKIKSCQNWNSNWSIALSKKLKNE